MRFFAILALPLLATSLPSPSPTPPAANAGQVSVSVPLGGLGEVWIDNRKVSSETPLLNYPLAPGHHEIAVVKNGRKSAQNITLGPGEKKILVIPLQP